jgi:hypothetical protein
VKVQALTLHDDYPAGWHAATAPKAQRGAWFLTFSGVTLLYLYASRFVPDVVLLPVAALYLLIGTVRFSIRGLTVVAIACILLSLQVFVHGGRAENPGQILHLISLLMVFIALDDAQFAPDVLVSFCKFTTIVNVVLLGLWWVPLVAAQVFWTDGSGIRVRFQSLLPEPSFVALYSILNFFVLIQSGKKRLAYLNLLPLVLSYSFTGYISFALLALVYFRKLWLPITGGITILSLGMLSAYVAAPEAVTTLIVGRALYAAGGGTDESVSLRLLAPVDLIRSVASDTDSVALATGLGVGNVERYIYYQQSALPNYWRGTGVRSTQPDSVIAFVVAAFGVPAALAVAFWLLMIISRSTATPVYSVAKAYVVLISVSSGLFISPHFFAWIYLLKQERRLAEGSAVGTETAVSGR